MIIFSNSETEELEITTLLCKLSTQIIQGISNQISHCKIYFVEVNFLRFQFKEFLMEFKRTSGK